MRPRFPIFVLSLSLALLPISGLTLFALGPSFDFWWTPYTRLLFLVLVADMLFFLTSWPVLLWSVVCRSPREESNPAGEEGRLPKLVWIGAVALLACAATYRCTRAKCYQLEEQGDFTAARQRCLDDGHDPAH